eukprot:11619836-Prorocentrum_lima.AAC.1
MLAILYEHTWINGDYVVDFTDELFGCKHGREKADQASRFGVSPAGEDGDPECLIFHTMAMSR